MPLKKETTPISLKPEIMPVDQQISTEAYDGWRLNRVGMWTNILGVVYW